MKTEEDEKVLQTMPSMQTLDPVGSHAQSQYLIPPRPTTTMNHQSDALSRAPSQMTLNNPTQRASNP
jgi:hypothetical protein